MPTSSTPSPAAPSTPRILLVFVDGLGLAPADAAWNPLGQATLPTLRALLEEHTVPADATLGVAGTPQSGTGQTALLTGLNAPRLFGRHFGPWVPVALRDTLAEASLLHRAVRAGRDAAFANAYPLDRLPRDRARWKRPAAPPIAAHAAGLLTRGPEALRAGDALVSSLRTDRWREHVDRDAPAMGPDEAGVVLARIAGRHDLTLFAHYETDAAGHAGELAPALAALRTLDRFLEALLAALPDDVLLVVASDHGNLEDLRAGHTRNPVPVAARGPRAPELLHAVTRLTDVTPAILSLLDVQEP